MSTQSSSVPALALPNELTTHVFLHCLPLHGRVRPDPKTGPLLVAQIRHWRAVALSFPALWASIALDFHSGMAEPVISQRTALAGLWLSRASRSPLSITINAELLPGSRLPAGICSLIKSLSAQWGRLELMIPAPDFLELCEVAGPFPHLQVVAINPYRDQAEYRVPFLHSPKLQVLRLSDAFIGCFECEPGEPSQSISAVECPIRRSATEIFRMFEKFPNLHHLIVTANCWINDLPPQLSFPPCPPLHSLSLDNNCAVGLKHLTLPTLRHLEIVISIDGCDQLIADFVARSSCTLTYLGLEFIDNYWPLELECVLRAAPSVVSLRLGFSGLNSTPQSACFVLHRLDILPHLTNIYVRGWGKGNVNTWDMCLGLIQARPALLMADFCEMDERIPPPTAQQITGFEAAAERGMRITLRREGYRDKPWQWPDGPEEDMDENFFGFATSGSLPSLGLMASEDWSGVFEEQRMCPSAMSDRLGFRKAILANILETRTAKSLYRAERESNSGSGSDHFAVAIAIRCFSIVINSFSDPGPPQ
ncbi:hypothetical protein GGX14DRAFT_596975 [Mycena pura]|uniref:F-box domain-containing protein n=1 Tax=Mycena pura TaxID=153505 RepID=A0AAD6USB0_9AGAR|nr:hypothetical protein GGX14DRAFT_596975 [Mycena pura]